MHPQMRAVSPMDQHLRLLGPATSQTMEPVPWNHTVPMAMPWFQGQNPFPSNYPYSYEHARRLFHNKRKGDEFDDVPAPIKQYISEEAMSAHLNQMHISNTYSPIPSCSTADENLSPGCQSSIHTLQELEARLQESIDLDADCSQMQNGSRLVLAPEISEIKTEPILPRSIVNHIQKPALELVLWKPPGGLVEDLIRSVLDGDDSNKNSEKNSSNEVDIMESMPSEFMPLQNANTTNYISGKPYQFRSYTVPAMSQYEIDSLEEEMNL